MKNSWLPIKFSTIFLGAGVMLALYASSLYRYLLFHSLVEMFSVLVAFVIFILAWNTRRVQDNHYFLFIGIASLFSGALDLTHTFAYKGLGVFTGYSEDLATQLWIAFRYVFSLSFLFAPFFIERKLKAPRIFAVYFFITSLLLVTIFLRRFPACYVQGTGLTSFKIISEYIISFIFLASLGLLLRKRSAFDRGVLRLVVLSLLSSIASELSFSHYVSVYGVANMIGHYFELLSYYLIYRAIVVTGVVEPSTLLFRNLKLSEEALRESEARYRSLFENMIDGFALHKVIVDEAGRPVDYVFLEVNSAFEGLTGLKREDVAGKRVREVLPGIENDPADWIGTYGRVALTGKEIRFEQYAGPLDKWYSVTAYSPMKEHFVAVFEDITERKKTEEALRKAHAELETRVRERTAELANTVNTLQTEVSERLRVEQVLVEQSRILEAFFKHSAAPLVFLDKEFNFIRVNDAYAKACSREVSDFQGHNHFADYPSDELKEKFARVVETKEPFSVFARPFAFSDHPEWGVTYWDLFLYPVLDSSGEVDFLVFSLHEVTERKRAEEKVLRLNRLYSVLSKINEAIVRIHDPEKLYEQVCRIAVEDGLFKMAWIGLAEPETLMVKPVASWGDTGGYLDHIKIYAADVSEGRGPTGTAVLEGTYSICSDIEHDTRMLPWRNKALRHGFRSSAAFPLHAGSAVSGALTIYSDKPQFFTDEETNLLSSLAEDVSFAIDSMANEKERVRLAAAVESVAEAVVITDLRGIVQYVNPAFEKMTGYAKEEAVGRDLHMLDGDKQGQDFYRTLRKTLKRDGVWTGRLTSKKKDGTLYHEDCTYSVIRNPSGEIINYVSIKRDVTERLRLESIAEAVNTMDSIGYIFSGVRHEIGNPINSINMILGILKSKLDVFSKENIREYVDRMATQLLNIEDILRSLKSFNMYETLERQDVQISTFIEKFLQLVKEDFQKKGIAIDASVDPEAKRTYADPRALQQVLINILTNASDAMNGRKDPKVTINISRTGSMVRIRVEDNGCGIPEEKLKDLFKPFYTTKAKGTGLGLVIVKKMLAKMDGVVEITSRKDEGTRVDIFIPERKE